MLFDGGFTFANFVADAFAIFMFILWFWLLITVSSDLFRRHDISGLGKVAFVSDRNAFKGTNTGYAPNALALQLFVMDDPPHPDPLPQGERERNVDCIGHLNLGMALHPVILKDGRIMFSTPSAMFRGSRCWRRMKSRSLPGRLPSGGQASRRDASGWLF